MVERSAPPRHAADELPVVVDHRCRRHALHRQPGEDLLEVGAGVDHHQIAAHHVLDLREPVVAGGVALGEDADRLLLVVDDDHCSVGPFVDETERIAERAGRRERDRRFIDRVPRLHVADHRLDDVERDVLREHRHTAAAGDRLRHPPTGDGRHVRHDDRERRPEPIGRREVDVEARRHRGQARHHEHVVVGQVVRRRRAVQEPHG